MRNVKRLVLAIILLSIALTMPVFAKTKIKTYKANKVTAKQIVTELKKTMPITNVKAPKKDDISFWTSHPNGYKTKINFTDKKYKKVYCSIEVFRDAYDAVTRDAEMRALNYIYGTFDIKVDIPLLSYRYKNILIRFDPNMPNKYAIKYYNALKKIVK